MCLPWTWRIRGRRISRINIFTANCGDYLFACNDTHLFLDRSLCVPLGVVNKMFFCFSHLFSLTQPCQQHCRAILYDWTGQVGGGCTRELNIIIIKSYIATCETYLLNSRISCPRMWDCSRFLLQISMTTWHYFLHSATCNYRYLCAPYTYGYLCEEAESGRK